MPPLAAIDDMLAWRTICGLHHESFLPASPCTWDRGQDPRTHAAASLAPLGRSPLQSSGLSSNHGRVAQRLSRFGRDS
jgi:hypothetical protein